jgi:Asp-tRNA(Asn)/Glu-tRNA(Gln) amidotransferase A subunit family amidase
VLHAPCIGLPAGKGAKGLPLGVQLVGTRRQDERLLRWGAWAEPLLRELLP